MKLAATFVFSLVISFGIVALATVATLNSASGVSAAPAAEAAAPAVYAPGFHSRWVGQSGPATIRTGTTTLVTISYRNIGTQSWVKGVPGEQANLGLNGEGASLAAGWATPDRLAVQNEAVVKSGEIATFTFGVRAPDTKSYRLAVRPVIDGVTWLEDEGAFFTFSGTASGPLDDVLSPVLTVIGNPVALLMLAEWVGVVALLYVGRSVFRRLAHA